MSAKLKGLELEALLLRYQQAIDIVAKVPHPQRESLLAAVICPPPEVLEWSLERARAKLERNLAA